MPEITSITTLIETVAIAAISGIAVPIFQSVWEGGGKALERLGKGVDEPTRESITKAAKRYTKNYTERHGTLKVLGMREPVSLESVYTAVQVLERDRGYPFESLEDCEESFRQGSKRRFTPPDQGLTQSGLMMAKQQQYLMVLGAPGVGKSTFLKRIGLEALKGKRGELEYSCIPVFIELKRFDSESVDLESIIFKEFEISGFPASEVFTRKLLEQGKLLILLDGLDEVPGATFKLALRQIQDFVDRYSHNRYLISCRTGTLGGSFPRFTDAIIADFDDRQIEQFINNWFSGEEDQQAGTGQKCWELLQKPQNAAAKELAHTPLLLTFLCRVYDLAGQFPSNRSILYHKALRILLEEWASEKRVQRDEVYQGLHAEAEEILLSEIAYHGFEEERFFFSKRELIEAIRSFLADNLNAPQNLDGEMILSSIILQQGILVKRAEEVYSFSHITLQEYLTAQYIVDRHQLDFLVQNHLTDAHWQEVFVLVSGLLRSGSDQLLMLMEGEILRLLSTQNRLIPFLDWVDRVTMEEGGKYEPTEKRAIAIALALTFTPARRLARALAPNLTRSLMEALTDTVTKNPLLELAQRLQKLEIFQPEIMANLVERLENIENPNQEEMETRQNFTQFLKNICLEAFDLTLDLLNFSERETQALRDYLYANQLMVRCQQASVRVSIPIWEAIEGRMLRGSIEIKN